MKYIQQGFGSGNNFGRISCKGTVTVVSSKIKAIKEEKILKKCNSKNGGNFKR